jgi:Ca-activated chloride channel family protein
MFRFAYPGLLSLLILVAGYLVLSLWRRPPSLSHSAASSLARFSHRRKDLFIRIPTGLRMLVLIALILAAARPQFYNVSREIRSPGVDIMLALDTSGSMRALDFKLGDEPVTRLTAVKKVVRDFIMKRETDRIGLLVFGEEAFTQSPLTMDKGLLLNLVDKMEIGMAGDATAIGSGIVIASKRLKDLKAKARILILLTDGRHNAGRITPGEAAEAAQALGVKIYTIGVGGIGPAPFKVRTMFGSRIIYQNVDLDEDTLKKVARLGKGKYFRAANSKELSEIYDIIDREEKTEIKIKEFFHFRELYAWFLVPALVLLVLELLLKSTVLRVIP